MLSGVTETQYAVPDYGDLENNPVFCRKIKLVGVLLVIGNLVRIQVPFVFQFGIGNHSRLVLNQTKETHIRQKAKPGCRQNMNYNDCGPFLPQNNHAKGR